MVQSTCKRALTANRISPINQNRVYHVSHLQSGGIVQLICMPQSLALSVASFTEGLAADGVLVSSANKPVTDSGRKRATPACTHACMLILCQSQKRACVCRALLKACNAPKCHDVLRLT